MSFSLRIWHCLLKYSWQNKMLVPVADCWASEQHACIAEKVTDEEKKEYGPKAD